ncbi:hypothetical protein ABG067_007670, partial [Albugo candida]
MHFNRSALLQGIKKICEDFEFDTTYDFDTIVKQQVYEMFNLNRTYINNMAAVIISLGFEVNQEIFLKNDTQINAIFPRLERTRSNRAVSTHPEPNKIESEGSLETEPNEIESDGSLQLEPLESIPLIESHAESEPTRVEPGPAEPILLYSPETAESTRSLNNKRKRRIMSEAHRSSERLAKRAKVDEAIERVATEPIEPIVSVEPVPVPGFEPIELVPESIVPIEPVEP